MSETPRAPGDEALSADVIVVGAGPVGLALAADLGSRGRSVILLERGDGVPVQPRMDVVGVRSMEFCRRWGIAGQVRNAGYNRKHPQDFVYVTGLATGWELGREPSPPPEREPTPPQSPEHRERCPQNFFDPVLADFARGFPSVSLRYQTEMLRFDEDAQGVQVVCRPAAGGPERTLRARFLVGCDGGGSTVRQQMGVAMEGEEVLTYTTNAIFRCPGFFALHDRKPGYRYIFVGPEGTWCTIVAIDGRDNYRFSLVGDRNKQALGEDEIRALICQAMGQPFDFEILSVLRWIRREQLASAFTTGRVHLAGDACHLMSPTGGFGMNTGLQEAVDLAWKIDAVCAGWGGPGLLASYEAERRPVALRNIREAGSNLRRMLSSRVNRPAPEVFQPGPAGDAARREFGAHYAEVMRREWFTIGIHLGYRYEGSPVVVPDGTPEPEDTVLTYEPTARPGHRAPHAWLADGRSTLDLFGRGFTLLRFAPTAAVDALVSAAAGQQLPLQVVDIADAAIATLYERPLCLVRPDGHVVWRGDSVPADAAALVARVRGA
jgi:2-polyprenyl-6-methoxyphenol hydroxylase-like FAD-dependent oxidoreductase